MKELWKLFRAFFSVGLFTFGGGYAMLPMLKREVVEKYGWATEEELLDCYAIAQCTPGVIAVNTATHIGYKVHKVSGSIVATFAVVLPSLIIISVIATVLKQFSEYPIVAFAFAGIRVAVAVLVTRSVIELYKKGVQGALANVVFVIAILVGVFTNISPVILVLAAILLGIVLRKAGKKV